MEYDQSYGVFFSNLEDTISEMEIAVLIISLIFQTTGILVPETDVKMRHSNPCKCHIACVNLYNPELQQHTVESIQQQQKDNQIPKGLVKNGRVLRVDYFQPKQLQKALMSQPVNNKLLTPGRTYLVKNQQLGNETRSLEFKKGFGSIKKRKVSKYICAFLNSEGGHLMVGIDDQGVVQGIQCDHKTEDCIRIMIDQLIHRFDPPVLPQMYQLDFIPVRDDTEANTNLKVMEIAVSAGRSDILYETPEGEVYIRRDGSVQGPLRAKDIQEWCHLKFGQEQRDRENNLKEQMKTLEVRIQKIEQGGQSEQMIIQSVHPTSQGARLSPAESLLAMSSQLERKNSLKRSNSKVCVIL